MDPRSAVFAVYLEITSSTIHSNITDRLGTEIQAVVVEYEGMEIPLQHSMLEEWKTQASAVVEEICSWFSGNFSRGVPLVLGGVQLVLAC